MDRLTEIGILIPWCKSNVLRCEQKIKLVYKLKFYLMTVYFRFVEFFKIIDILYENNHLLIQNTKNAVFMYAYIYTFVCM